MKKASDKDQHPFMIKTLTKVGIEGKYLNIIKLIYDEPTANIILKAEETKAFLLNLKQDKDAHSPLLFNILLEVLATATRQTKEIKATQTGRDEVKLSLYETI